MIIYSDNKKKSCGCSIRQWTSDVISFRKSSELFFTPPQQNNLHLWWWKYTHLILFDRREWIHGRYPSWGGHAYPAFRCTSSSSKQDGSASCPPFTKGVQHSTVSGWWLPLGKDGMDRNDSRRLQCQSDRTSTTCLMSAQLCAEQSGSDVKTVLFDLFHLTERLLQIKNVMPSDRVCGYSGSSVRPLLYHLPTLAPSS